jgi:NADP-dependent 3-hydroxy acid dehydrogenase YdfG
MADLAGRRVLVTGGTTGIGLATARLLASAGAVLLVVGRNPEDLEAATRGIDGDGEIHGIQGDTSVEADVDRIFDEARARLGGLDVLVCNAAVAGDDIARMQDDAWRYVLDVNIAGYLACTKAAIAMMEPDRRGQVVLIGSMSAEVREKGSSVYVATKGAIRAFAASLRKEVNDRGIRVVLIEPGAVSTDMASGSEADQEKAVAEERMLLPEDVARCVRFVLEQPSRSDVVELQVRPHRQLI